MPKPSPPNSKPKRGFRLACPKCGDSEDEIFIYLHDLSVATCASCDESFNVNDAADHFQDAATAWARAIEWLREAPVIEGTQA